MKYVLNTYWDSFLSIEAISATINFANEIEAKFVMSEKDIPDGVLEEDIIRKNGLALYFDSLPFKSRFFMAAGLF